MGRAAVGTLTVVTGDIGTVNPAEWAARFNTILSVEMFEHMQVKLSAVCMGRSPPPCLPPTPSSYPLEALCVLPLVVYHQNYRALFAKLHGWLVPRGRLAVHVFDNAYSTDRFDPSSWIGKHFFTGECLLGTPTATAATASPVAASVVVRGGCSQVAPCPPGTCLCTPP